MARKIVEPFVKTPRKREDKRGGEAQLLSARLNGFTEKAKEFEKNSYPAVVMS